MNAKGRATFSNDDFDKIYRVIEIHRALVNIFSDPSTRLSSAFPLIEGACETLVEIANQSKGIKKAFILYSKKTLLSYTINNKNGGIWILAYSLTPKGLHDILLRFKNEKANTSTAENFKVISKKNSDNHNYDSELLDFEYEHINNLFYEEDNEIDDLQADAIENPQYIQSAVDELKYIADILEYDSGRTNHLLSVYDAYIKRYIKDLYLNKTLNLFNWASLYENEDLSDLADIALRLEPATCSEASAERAISTQRLIMEPRRDNAKKDLTDARLIYLRTKIDSIEK